MIGRTRTVYPFDALNRAAFNLLISLCRNAKVSQLKPVARLFEVFVRSTSTRIFKT